MNLSFYSWVIACSLIACSFFHLVISPHLNHPSDLRRLQKLGKIPLRSCSIQPITLPIQQNDLRLYLNFFLNLGLTITTLSLRWTEDTRLGSLFFLRCKKRNEWPLPELALQLYFSVQKYRGRWKFRDFFWASSRTEMNICVKVVILHEFHWYRAPTIGF